MYEEGNPSGTALVIGLKEDLGYPLVHRILLLRRRGWADLHRFHFARHALVGFPALRLLLVSVVGLKIRVMMLKGAYLLGFEMTDSLCLIMLL